MRRIQQASILSHDSSTLHRSVCIALLVIGSLAPSRLPATEALVEDTGFAASITLDAEGTPRSTFEDAGGRLILAGYQLTSYDGFPVQSLDAQPIIELHPSPTNQIPAGGLLRLEVFASPDPPPSYQWWFEDRPIPGATSNVLYRHALWDTNAGRYFVVVSNSLRTQTSVISTVTVQAPTDLPGSVDPTFNAFISPDSSSVEALLTLPDGSVWVGGYFQSLAGVKATNLAILRFTPHLQVVAVGSRTDVQGLWLQPGGRVLAANPLRRYFPDGSPDSTFPEIPGGQSESFLAMRPDGSFYFYAYDSTKRKNVIGRYLSDGSPDPLFTPVEMCSSATSLTLQEQDRLLFTIFSECSLSGTYGSTFMLWRDGSLNIPAINQIQATLNRAGLQGRPRFLDSLLDGTSIGMDNVGWISLDKTGTWKRLRPAVDHLGHSPFALPATAMNTSAALLQADGSWLVAGSYTHRPTPSESLPGILLRYHRDTLLDTNRPPIHVRTGLHAGGLGRAMTRLQDGRILLGGRFSSVNGIAQTNLALLKGPIASLPEILSPETSTEKETGDALVLEALAKEAPFISFQWLRNGIAIPGATTRWLSIPNLSMSDAGDYSIVVSNSLGSVTGFQARVTIRPTPMLPQNRVQSVGSNDGSDGAIQTVTGLRDGRILLGGLFNVVNGVRSPGLAALTPDGRVDSNIAALAHDLLGTNYSLQVKLLLPLPEGGVLVGSTVRSASSGKAHMQIVRLNPDGSLDPGFSLASELTGSGYGFQAMAVTSYGTILVSRRILSFGSTDRLIHALRPDGSYDEHWNSQPGIPVAVNNSLILHAFLPLPEDRWLIGTQASGATQPALWQLDNGKLQPIRFNPYPWGNPWGNYSGFYWLVTATGLPRSGGTSNPDPSAGVAVIHPLADGAFLAGGDLRPTTTTLTTNRLVRFRLSGTNAVHVTNLVAFSQGSVQFLRPLADGNLLVGGSFTAVEGQPRGGLAILSPDGSRLLPDSFGSGAAAGSPVAIAWSAWESADGRISIGGSFQQFGGKQQHHFVQFQGRLRLPILPAHPSAPSDLWGMEGHRYDLDHSPSLFPADWRQIGSWLGTNGFIPLPLANPAAAEGFYRLRAE